MQKKVYTVIFFKESVLGSPQNSFIRGFINLILIIEKIVIERMKKATNKIIRGQSCVKLLKMHFFLNSYQKKTIEDIDLKFCTHLY